MAKLASISFTASGSWKAPAGVTKVYILGQGGGGGGEGGFNSIADFANAESGGATTPYLVSVVVVPNTTYTVTIGAGGTGGAPRTAYVGQTNEGDNSTFGALWTFLGAPGNGNYTNPDGGGAYDKGAVLNRGSYDINSGFVRFTATWGTPSGTYESGATGLPGAAGSAGGTGGNGNNAGTGTNGGNATGIGSGGGGGGNGSTAGGSGGNGAPGQITVMWVE